MRYNEIEATMAALAKRRPVFHSGADFQHELARTIHERHPDAGMRLEYPLPLNGYTRFDIWLADGPTAIELKYWKGGEALDLARYDFRKQIDHLESLIADLWIDTGYVVTATNYLAPASTGALRYLVIDVGAGRAAR